MDLLIAPYTVPKEQADTAPLTGTPGWATDGNPAANKPATQWPAYAFNAVQEELATAIQAAGITLDRNSNSQLLAAIRGLITQRVASSSQAQAWTDDSVLMTPKKLADAFKGANQQLAASGYQKLPGGIIEQWFTANNTNNLGTGFSRTSFPIAFPNACRGISITTITSSGGGYQVGFACFVSSLPASFDWTAYNASGALAPTASLISIHVRAIGN